MSNFKVPTGEPSRRCAVAAITGSTPAVVVQDDYGNQVFVTPKMARALANELREIADVADGKCQPDFTRGVMFPASSRVM
jgi:hypothetical protein